MEFQTQRLKSTRIETHLNSQARRIALERDLRVMLTPDVLRFLPPQLTLESGVNGIKDWIAQRRSAAEVYTISEIGAEDVIGLLFLMPTSAPELREHRVVSLGYMFAESVWGKGYASELIAAVLSNLRDCSVRGGVAVGNSASVRVLTKNGFHINKDLSDHEVEMYEIIL